MPPPGYVSSTGYYTHAIIDGARNSLISFFDLTKLECYIAITPPSTLDPTMTLLEAISDVTIFVGYFDIAEGPQIVQADQNGA